MRKAELESRLNSVGVAFDMYYAKICGLSIGDISGEDRAFAMRLASDSFERVRNGVESRMKDLDKEEEKRILALYREGKLAEVR